MLSALAQHQYRQQTNITTATLDVQAIACIVMSPLKADTLGACFRIGKERWWRHIRAGVQRRAEATPEARGVVFVAL